MNYTDTFNAKTIALHGHDGKRCFNDRSYVFSKRKT